jgi:hypothetical protein
MKRSEGASSPVQSGREVENWPHKVFFLTVYLRNRVDIFTFTKQIRGDS